MSFLTRESLLVDSANRDNHDLLLMVLTGAYGPYTTEDVNNALIRAAINGNSRCVSLLLDWGADTDAEDMDGDTPLMLAACNNHIKVVKMLLKAQCLVNRVSDRRRTALHMAAWVGNEQICRLLLQAGADAAIQEMYGDTALMLAAHRSPNVARLLAQEAGRVAVNMKNESGDSALGCATKSGHLDCVRDLIEAGADVNSSNRHGETALMFATYENHPKLAQFLIDNGANPNIATQSGAVPLHVATKKNLTEMFYILLESGADPDLSDKMGQRALTFAIAAGNAAMVTKLIQAGSNPRYQGPSLFHRASVVMTPLYKALWSKRLDIANVLYSAGSCAPVELQEIYHCEDLQSELGDTGKGRDVLAFVKDIALSPAPLRLLCLQNVQACVRWGGAEGRRRIMSLKLPKPLKAALLLEDTHNVHDK